MNLHALLVGTVFGRYVFVNRSAREGVYPRGAFETTYETSKMVGSAGEKWGSDAG